MQLDLTEREVLLLTTAMQAFVHQQDTDALTYRRRGSKGKYQLQVEAAELLSTEGKALLAKLEAA